MCTIDNDMLSNSLLDGLVSRTLLAVLAVLFGPGEPKLHLREIERRTGLKMPGLRRILIQLADKGIVTAERSGNRLYYQANTLCPIYPELKMLTNKTSGLVGCLRDALDSLGDKIKIAFIYGSYAKGTEDGSSDIDLLVVGNTEFKAVSDALFETEKMLGIDVNPTVYSLEEFKSKAAAGSRFVDSVLSGGKIFLIGDADELGSIVE
jgi:predicted nucleotidyltransferase